MSERGLGRRSWTFAQGVPLLAGILTLAGVVLAVAATTQHSQYVQMLVVAGVLALGVLLFFAARALRGTPAVHRHLARARQQWAGEWQWTYLGDEPDAGATIAGLVLPRGWDPPLPAASMRGQVQGRDALVQTWALRSAPTSKRQSSHREMVAVRVRTGGYRCAVISAVQIDPALITPSWVSLRSRGRDRTARTHIAGDPMILDTWGPAIQSAVQAREDLPLTVAVGDDHVVVLALDDPRVSTMQARLDLAVAVADIIDPSSA